MKGKADVRGVMKSTRTWRWSRREGAKKRAKRDRSRRKLTQLKRKGKVEGYERGVMQQRRTYDENEEKK